MPAAVPLVGAALSVTAGAGVVAAAGGWAAASLGTALIGGAMIAGGALTAIGAITGNKKLTKLGGVLSIAGGVGGLATGAFQSTASSIFESSSASNTLAQTGADTLAGSLVDGGSTAMSLTGQSGGALTQAGLVAGESPFTSLFGADMAGAIQPANGFIEQAAGNLTAQQAAQTGSLAAPMPAKPSILEQTAGKAWDTLKQAPKWIKDNKEMALIGSSLVGGAASAYQQQKAARQAREQELADRDAYNQSVLGLQVPRWQPAMPRPNGG